ncbi:MAG: UDP-N-acetylglucosamine 2-epimerase (non-hydrolyzing) [Methanobacterium sp. BRmetb2]|nr:MAG: UDP-N-acetylglucosamine 2-epimerase (non-hydrolyzing) [Methanobacterium sp. BRmetb2]
MKIAIIIGTRPEIIKMAPVIDEIEKRALDYLLIHTGQHYDHEMSDQFFLDLELKKPDYNIGVGSGSHGTQTATMMKGLEKVLIEEQPDMVMVQGDTNAVLAGAIVAAKLHIPVGHVESGLRSFDKSMPEELNRMVADVCSKLYYVPTEDSALNLVFEGISPHQIFITGNTVVDACLRNLKIAQKNFQINPEVSFDKDIMVVTMHRAENVDHPQRLQNIVEALIEIDDLIIIFPSHPRTVKNLKEQGLYEKLDKCSHIKLIKPVGYLDFLLLLSRSKFVMTDSGGIQEEAITLDIPCLTLRYNTERPETVFAGGNILVGTKKEQIINNFYKIFNDNKIYNKMKKAHNPYGDGKASQKILDASLKMQNMGKLSIEAPEDIMLNFNRNLLKVNDQITVLEFEKVENALVKIVYDNENPRFPYPHMDLKNKYVIVEKFNK